MNSGVPEEFVAKSAKVTYVRGDDCLIGV
jgi:hypothetical protein